MPLPPEPQSTSSGGHLASRDEPRGAQCVALAVFPQRDSTFVFYFQSVMCLDLPAPLPSYKHVQVADAAASSPLSAFGAAILQPPNLPKPGKVGPGLRTQIWRLGLRCGDLGQGPGQLLNTQEFPGAPGWASPRESREMESGQEERQVLGLKAGPVLKELLRLGLSSRS